MTRSRWITEEEESYEEEEEGEEWQKKKNHTKRRKKEKNDRRRRIIRRRRRRRRRITRRRKSRAQRFLTFWIYLHSCLLTWLQRSAEVASIVVCLCLHHERNVCKHKFKHLSSRKPRIWMFDVTKLSNSRKQIIRRSDLEVNSAPCLPAKLQTAVLNICKRETTGLRDIGTTSNSVCTREPLWPKTRCFFEP